jgi:hypothetical protein
VTEVLVLASGYEDVDFPSVGDPFTGFYTIDSNAIDRVGEPARGGFRTVLSTTAIGVTIGDLGFEGLATSLSTRPDSYEIRDWIPSIELTSDPSLAQRLDFHNFLLEVRRDNLLENPDNLPLQPPSLAGAEVASLRMILDNGLNLSPIPHVSIVGTLDTLRLVPEPQSVLLLLAAVSGGCFVRGGHGKPTQRVSRSVIHSGR